MITKDCIETAYAFLHQKQRIYQYSTLEWQRDDIEMAVAAYADCMSSRLLQVISKGRAGFLREHGSFPDDIASAVDELEKLMKEYQD